VKPPTIGDAYPLEDDELGIRLASLPVPEHAAGFYAELREQLAWERYVLRDVLDRRRRLRRRIGVAAMAAAAVAAAVVTGIGGVGLWTDGPEAATAAHVRTVVATALSDADSLSGIAVARQPVDSAGGEMDEARWSFLLTDRGDLRITGITHPTDLAYDASANVQLYADEANFSIRTGMAPGWPDSEAPDWMIQRGLGSIVGVLGTSGDPVVEDVEHEGRPAWRLVTETENPGEELELTIDRETGVPVRELLFSHGELVSEFRIDAPRVDAPVPPDSFGIEPETGQELSRRDDGFRRVSLASVEDTVGYDPLVPQSLPSGYEPAEIAVAARARPTGDDGLGRNPVSRGVVSLAYRRGLDEIVISTRLIGPDPARWSDPVLTEASNTTPEIVTFSRGALDGARGELVLDPEVVPHVWGMTDRLVVTVAGDLTREELIHVAESLA
jgi:hypothetical protein